MLWVQPIGCIDEDLQECYTCVPKFEWVWELFCLALRVGSKINGVNVLEVNHDERMKLGIQLEDYNGHNGLIENRDDVRRICQQYNRQKKNLSSSAINRSRRLEYLKLTMCYKRRGQTN